MNIPIADAKKVALERGCAITVVFGISKDEASFAVASYGLTKALCKVGGVYADALADAVMAGKVRLPDEEPPDSEEVSRLLAEVERLRAELARRTTLEPFGG